MLRLFAHSDRIALSCFDFYSSAVASNRVITLHRLPNKLQVVATSCPNVSDASNEVTVGRKFSIRKLLLQFCNDFVQLSY